MTIEIHNAGALLAAFALVVLVTGAVVIAVIGMLKDDDETDAV